MARGGRSVGSQFDAVVVVVVDAVGGLECVVEGLVGASGGEGEREVVVGISPWTGRGL